jgi:hypothetical protein
MNWAGQSFAFENLDFGFRGKSAHDLSCSVRFQSKIGIVAKQCRILCLLLLRFDHHRLKLGRHCVGQKCGFFHPALSFPRPDSVPVALSFHDIDLGIGLQCRKRPRCGAVLHAHRRVFRNNGGLFFGRLLFGSACG